MAKPTTNLQDSFLNQVRKDNAEVKVALVDGTMLRGTVRGFDNFTVVLQVGGMQHLLYKHAISQIVSRRAPRRDREDRPTDEAEAPAAEDSQAEPFNTMDLSGVKAADAAPSTE
ncbi:RNA chaperone Hfq [Candidatus Sumerlaeota bacterium]|nr:RNA chaperone Hfq [Candidatus Sumerlaeota bacterium]